MQVELTGALAGLRWLDFADRAAYGAALGATQRLCWQQYFPLLYCHYVLDGGKKLLIEEIDGSVCIYRLSESRGKPTLSLYFLPMPMNDAVLRRCLERIREFNGDARALVFWVEDGDLGRLDGFGTVEPKTLERQYLYDPRRYGDLSGRASRNLRRSLDKIATRTDVVVRPYVEADRAVCLALLDTWADLQNAKYEAVRYRRYTENCLREAGRFDARELFGRVVEVDGRVAAFGFSGEIRPAVGSLFIGYADLDIAGLNQFLNVSMLRELGDCEFANAAMANTPGLRFAKEALLPVAMLGVYRVRLGVPRTRAVAASATHWAGCSRYWIQDGPGLAGWRPCLRALLAPEVRPAAPVGGSALKHLRALLAKATDAALPERLGPETPLAVLYGELGLLLQKIHHFPVGWGSAHKLAGNAWEVTFEIARADYVAELIECVEALVASALDGGERFLRVYRRNRDELAARMWQLFMLERRRTAQRLGIPFAAAYPRNVARLGHARYGEPTAPGYTGATASLAKVTAGDKRHTFHVLRTCGVPVARQIGIRGEVEDAVAAAEAIGYPVVVKPRDSHRGKGVSVNLGDAEAVRAAFEHAGGDHRPVLVEQFLQGDDYRLLVVGGRCIATVRRPLPTLVGDGVHSVAELVDIANRDHRRDGLFLDPLTVDAAVEAVLAGQDLAPAAIPAAGRTVWLRRAASPESATEDVSAHVHPDNVEAAVAATAVCGLDIAGIDMISPDIGVAWRDNGAGIVEVNAGPGIDLHTHPNAGKPRDVHWHMLRTRFAAAAPAAVPTAMVVGRYGKRTTVRRIGGLLAMLGRRVGVCAEGRAWVAGRELADDHDDLSALERVFAHPGVDAAVFEVSGRDLAFDALPVECATVSVLTDASCTQALLDESQDPQLPVRMQRLAVEIAAEAAVIDGTVAELRAVAAMRPPAQVGYVWNGAADPEMALTAHLLGGGWAVVAETDAEGAEHIVWRSAAADCRIAAWSPANAAADEDAEEARRQTLFAVAVAIALGHDPASLALPTTVCGDGRLDTLLAWRAADGPLLAHADYRDDAALARLRHLHAVGPAGGCLRIVLAAEPGAMAQVARLAATLGGDDTLWCCAGPFGAQLADGLRACGVAPHAVDRCLSLARGVEGARMDASARDTVALLAVGDSERTEVLRAPEPWIEAGDEGAGRWTPHELARLFDGRWVGGPRRGWSADEVRWTGEKPTAGSVVVVPGDAADADGDELVVQRIAAAFAGGAAAVIAPFMPADMPRWRSLLVCDDPALGMRRLAQRARARLRGPLVGCAADLPPLLLMRICATLDALAPAHVVTAGANAGVPSLMQALAAIPDAAPLTLVEMPGRGGALSVVRPDLWIGTAHGNDVAELRNMLSVLPPDTAAVFVAPLETAALLLGPQSSREAPLVLIDAASGAVTHQWPAGTGAGEPLEHCLARLLRPRLPAG